MPSRKMYIFFLLSTLFGVGHFEVFWMAAGKSQIFTFATTVVEDGHTINWLFKRNETSNQTLFRCTRDGLMCDPSDDSFRDLYTVNITSNATSIISVFTIKYVTPFHHNTTWFSMNIFRQGRESAQYNLYVFALAESPTCGNSSLLLKNEIQIQCWTLKVFSESVCVFYIKTNNTSSNEIKNGRIKYTHFQNVTTGYYKTNCSYFVSAETLGPGSHMFHVVMYPNITSNITEGIKTTSRINSPIEIYFPKATFADDCKIDNYIEESSTRRCTCYNNNTSFLPTQVIWTHDGSIISSDGKLDFLASRQSSNQQDFICTVSNELSWADQSSYKPNVAYGPDNVNLLIKNPLINKCENENTVDIVGTCVVSENNPPPSVYIIVDNSWIQLRPGTVKNEYGFNIPVYIIGIVDVTCYANNSVFGDITAQINQYVNITGSSNVLYVFSITNNIKIIPLGNKLPVNGGMTSVFCEYQGIPLNTNMSLNCGNYERFVTNIGSLYMILNISKETGNVNCSCDLWTELRCPKITRSVTLTITNNKGDAVKETNSVAIGLGITTGIVVMTLLTACIVFIFWRRNQKFVHNSRAINKSEDYSMFEGKDSDQYENPDMQKKEFATSSENTMVPSMQNPHLSNNTLGGFISTDKTNESAPKNNDHIYEEVTEKVELVVVQPNNSYLNVKIN